MQRVFGSPSHTFDEVFDTALKEILRNGSNVRPRGLLTKEISPATLIVHPLYTIYTSKIRNLNFAFLLAENLWYISGRADTHLLSYYNSNIKNFSQDGLHDGAYGPKIVAQIRYVIDTLQKDPDSRQAIISLWERNPKPSKDVPCTSLFQFMIRDGKLNLYVTMRSNDIIFGSHYDVPSFALIQMFVASCLGLPVGTLFHTANSLHLYETHFELADNLIKEEPFVAPSHMQPPYLSLEEHTKQIDVLLGIEGYIRNIYTRYGQDVTIHNIDALVLSICPFYQQYAFIFQMYAAKKMKDPKTQEYALNMLKVIGSPFGEIYASRE